MDPYASHRRAGLCHRAAGSERRAKGSRRKVEGDSLPLLLLDAKWQICGLALERFLRTAKVMDGGALGNETQASQADVCSYALFLSESSATSLETPDLQAFCAEVLAYADSLCIEQSTGKSYIWQREAFSLAPSEDGRSLAGQTSFGESVEDEWFIVYLLREISKKYKDLIIKIEDTDGQFLLIEAAEVLPSWLNPENAENRVCVRPA